MITKSVHFTSGVSTYVEDAVMHTKGKVQFSGKTYYTVDVCAEYGCYYLGMKGGWNAFAFTGKCTKKDSYTQYEYYRDYNNTTIEFGRNRYVTEITPSWELHTGWLTDDQAENMVKNLFSSTQVYLHDLAENKIIPVVITDTTATYKTYANNNRKLIQYAVNFKASQDVVRR